MKRDAEAHLVSTGRAPIAVSTQAWILPGRRYALDVWPDALSGMQSKYSSPYTSEPIVSTCAWQRLENRRRPRRAALVMQALLGEEEEAFQYYGRSNSIAGYLS